MQEEKGVTADEMVECHHRLNRHEFEQTLGDKHRGSLACCSPWGQSWTWLNDWTTDRRKSLRTHLRALGCHRGSKAPCLVLSAGPEYTPGELRWAFWTSCCLCKAVPMKIVVYNERRVVFMYNRKVLIFISQTEGRPESHLPRLFWEAAPSFQHSFISCRNKGCQKAERWRIDAFELRYWRRLLRVPWTARRSNLNIQWKDWSWSYNTLATWCKELTH